MKTGIVLACASLAISHSALAEGVRLSGGGYSWNSELEGTISDGDELDLDNDLQFNHARQSGAYLTLEHDNHWLPNARLRYLGVRDAASTSSPRDLQFAGESFIAGDQIRNDLDLRVSDATLYYSLPRNNGGKVNVGLAARDLNGELEILSTSAQAIRRIDETLPVFHLAGYLPFPLLSDNAYLGAEANGIYLDEDQLGDFILRAGWQSDFLLGLEVGFHQMFIKLDEESRYQAVNLKFGGPYVALTLNFQGPAF